MHYSTQLDNGHCRTFFSYKRDSKEMHFIYDYGNYNWKEKRKKKKNFYKKFSVQYMNDHERGLNDRNVRHTR